MNEGILACIIQWCLLCLVWMGSFDQPLAAIGLRRGTVMAVLAASLVCAYADWRLYAAPVEVNVSGFLLPLAAAIWSCLRLPAQKRNHVVAASFLSATMLCFIRRILLFDPVLLLWDERFFLPCLLLPLLFFLTRNWQAQGTMLLLSLPLADAFFALDGLKYAQSVTIGGAWAQDLFWSAMAIWLSAAVCYAWVRSGVFKAVRRLLALFGWKSKTNPDSDAV